jgi:ferric-dicitrate binding protein FerR (iron transport regulator)
VPHQQSRLWGTASFDINEVDTDEVIAWKEGYFSFHKVRLREALREIARWYNLSFVYDDVLPADIEISGTLSKYESALQVLHKIELLGEVKFTARDTHVYVSSIPLLHKPVKK